MIGMIGVSPAGWMPSAACSSAALVAAKARLPSATAVRSAWRSTWSTVAGTRGSSAAAAWSGNRGESDADRGAPRGHREQRQQDGGGRGHTPHTCPNNTHDDFEFLPRPIDDANDEASLLPAFREANGASATARPAC